MAKHQAVLKKITRDLVGLDPICSVMAVGSIGRGDYRPDSDIDIITVTWRHKDIATELQGEHRRVLSEGGDGRLDSWRIDGIKVDMLAYSPLAHQSVIMRTPVWRAETKKILYDPSGIAAWGERCVRRFLRDNPGFEKKWREFQEEYQRWKRDSSTPRRFEWLNDFMATLDYSKAVFNYESFASNAL